MEITESLLSKQRQDEYRARFLKHIGTPKKTKRDFETYFSSPAFEQHVTSLVEGKFRLSVPDRVELPNGRQVFHYPKEEHFFLGYTNYVLHQVEAHHAKGLYTYPFSSGRRGFIANHLSAKAMGPCYVVKTDMRHYSYSIKTDVFLGVQRRLLADDPQTFALIESLCSQDRYRENGIEFETDVPPLIGTAMNSYINNTMLWEIDEALRPLVRHYGRYYDDIAFVVSSEQEAKDCLHLLKDKAAELSLELNLEKTLICDGEAPYRLVGVDICGQEASIPKENWDAILRSARPTARKLVKAVRRGELNSDLALRFALISLDAAEKTKIVRSIERVFPVITDVGTARDFDHAIQNWLRAIAAGTTSNAKYRISYDQLKAAGYTSMVERIYTQHRWA